MINISSIDINLIGYADNRRPLNPKAVDDLIASIDAIGLQTPITVRPFEGQYYQLVVGRHRLEAMRRLGNDTIDAVVRDCDEIEAELWEIAENLHRAELTALERDKNTARWIELTEQKRERVSTQDVSKPKGGRPESGIRAAARELGINREEARRAVKVASLSDEAQQTARDLGLDDNRSALLEAANEKTAAAQVAVLNVRGTQGTGDNEWHTPKEFLEAARNVLGDFDLDPASNAEAQKYVKAKRFFSKDDDGLKHHWKGRVWLNPPYAQPLIFDFVKKMVSEIDAGNVSEAIMLTHNYTDTEWFHRAVKACSAICFTRGRIKFWKSNGPVGQPTQGQAFFYFGRDPERFRGVFSKIGFVVIPCGAESCKAAEYAEFKAAA